MCRAGSSPCPKVAWSEKRLEEETETTEVSSKARNLDSWFSNQDSLCIDQAA